MSVRNVHPLIERNVGVCGAREDAWNVVCLKKLRQPQSHSQRSVLFLHMIPSRAFVIAAMTGIDDDGIERIRLRRP